ncbi:hypothetical protein ABZT03_44475, partial [Streptomyces sp. NPDC005574]
MPTYSDAQYAAALEAQKKRGRPLPKRDEGVEVNINGIVTKVPLGNFLNTQRNEGREREYAPELIKAFRLYHITPIQIGGKWAVPRDPKTTHIPWKDSHYAAALEAQKKRGLPLPKRDEGVEVNINGISVDVPLGNFLKTQRNEGREKEYAPELIEAFRLYHITPIQKDGKWAVPRDPKTTIIPWKDSHYAAALKAQKERGLPLPKRGEGVEVNINGIVTNVPLGNFLKAQRISGRKRAYAPELIEEFKLSGLSPVEVEGGWKTVAVADAGTGGLHGEQPQNSSTSYIAHDSQGYPAQRDSSQFTGLTQGMEGISLTASADPPPHAGPSWYSVNPPTWNSSAMPEPAAQFYEPSGGTGDYMNPVPQQYLSSDQGHLGAGPPPPAGPSSSTWNSSAMPEPAAQFYGPSGGMGDYPTNLVPQQYLSSDQGYLGAGPPPHPGPSSYAELPPHQNTGRRARGRR